jgi:hypothetical protein
VSRNALPNKADPEQAWKVLSLVNDWLKHAEAKAAGALTAAGVVGGVLYTLVGDKEMDWLPATAALVCAAAVLLAATCAAVSLWPRLKAKEAPTSPIYFDHIAREHADVSTYRDTLHLLTAKADEITKELAVQVWSNAHVAHKKYAWAGRAIAALLISIGALAVVVAYLGITNGQ